MNINNLKTVVFILATFLMIFNFQIVTEAQEDNTETILAVSDRTTAVRDAIVAAVDGVTDAVNVTNTHLAAITSLNLRNKSITALKSGDFSGMTGLTDINLYGNQLSSLPDGIFKGLTALTELRLGGNTVNPMQIAISLIETGTNEYKVNVPTGAPFAITVSIVLTGGVNPETLSSVTVAKGSVESASFTATAVTGATVEIGETLPSLPQKHYGYELITTVPDTETVTEPVTEPQTETQTETTEETIAETTEVTENSAPSFTEGTTTVRSIAENTAANTNIGNAVGATDTDTDNTLTYTLGGRDADSFAIEATTGQLKTKAALDYETKSVYLVSITVSDTIDTDTISVVISIIDVADTTISTAAVGVSDRTAEVRDAIVAAVPGVTDAANVTDTHLAAITALDLRNDGIISLKTGDFAGMTGMTSLNLYGNSLSSLPAGIFNGLTALRTLRLGGNVVSPMPIFVSLEQVSSNQYRVVIPVGAPFDVVVPLMRTDGSNSTQSLGTVTVSKGSIRSATQTVASVSGTFVDIGALPSLPPNHFGYTLSKSATCNVTLSVAEAIAAAVPGVTDCRNVSIAQLAAITSLNLSNKTISSLQSNDFAGMLTLSILNLQNNQLNSLPDGIFAGLISLSTLQLSGNTGAPFSFELSLEKVGTNQFKALLPVGAPYDISLPITVANGSAAGSATTITISQGSVESGTLTVTRTLNTFSAVTVDIGTLPSIPTSHNGYALSKSSDLPLTLLDAVNAAPVFTEGTAATRSIVENTAAGTNIGTPVDATDGNSSDTLVYSLSGTDAASFAIVTSTGQLQTRTALDYETKTSYTVIVTVTDNNLSDTITVTINVSDVAENVAPVFTDGTSTTRSIAENTAAGTNIGSTVSATDANTDTLTYTLGGTDAATFDIVSTTGQLQTKNALNYEQKNSYSVIVNVSDGEGGSDTIDVTINVTDVKNEDTQQVERNVPGTPSNNAPTFTEGDSTTRSIAENTVAGTNIGSVVSASDSDVTDTLTYTLSGTDAASFSIVSTTGQLQTKAALDYETKTSYTVTINVSDARGGTDSITVTINVTDVVEGGPNTAPVFTDGDSVVRYMAENTPAGVNIGAAITATDVNVSDALTYTRSGTDAASFTIVGTTGQLQTKAALDYETKESYSVTVTVSDGRGGTDSIAVTINISNVHENVAPVFPYTFITTRSIAENTVPGTNIGTPVAATDENRSDSLTYTLSGADAVSFAIVASTGQLQTKAALDYETKSSYTVGVTVSDGEGGSDIVNVRINVLDVHENVAPVFTEGTTATRSIAENSVAGTNIGIPLNATDANGTDSLIFSLGGTDAASFAISSTTGQLQTNASLDYETKSRYVVTITVSDGSLSDTITVTINVTDVQEGIANNAPTFADGDSTTRSINENTASGINIGSTVSATDLDSGDTLTYSLSGTDAESFAIIGTTGQLQTSVSLNYEVKNTYSVNVAVSDSKGGTDSIAVTINVTDVNDPPRFVDGTSATITIAENIGFVRHPIGTFNVIDEDGDRLYYQGTPFSTDTFRIEYSGGGDYSSIPITYTGKGYVEIYITRDANLNFATRSSYTLRLAMGDSQATGVLNVTINITDVENYPLPPPPPPPPPANNIPYFFNDSVAIEIEETIGANQNVGYLPHRDRDNDPLTFSLSGADAESFVTGGAFIKTKNTLEFVPFDYETKSGYSFTAHLSDGRGGTDTTVVIINITDVNEAPVFDDGTTTTRTIAENAAAGINIGSTLSVTDQDRNDTIVYTLGGTDAAAFSIDSSSGQLQTKAALDYETKSSYTVTITATDKGVLTDTITVTINVRDLNETPSNNAPVFTEGTTTTRSVAENTASNTNIGNAITATDADIDSLLSYQLSGTDAASFSIVGSTGQLQTNAALDYETKSSYTVTVSVTDGTSTDTITVTINVTDANDAPVFSDGTSTTRSIDEGTAADINIGASILATDPEEDPLTYSLAGTDADSFTIVSTTGQLKTKAPLRFETKSVYSVTVSVSDGNLTSTINVTINVNNVNRGGPAFVENIVTLTVEEGSPAGTNIGEPITAEDIDDDPLEYELTVYNIEGYNSVHFDDYRSFDVDINTGQIKVKDALDYDTKNVYKLRLRANDIQNFTYVVVIINVVRRNTSPVFTDGTSTSRSVVENTASDQNIGSPVAATDADSDTLTYSLGGTDANSFSIDSTTGQLKTKAELDYETKSSYSVTVTTTDNKPRGSVAITVTINVTDVLHENNSAPEFTDGATTTRSVAENSTPGTNIGTAVAATDVDTDDIITYTLGGTDAASFTIVSTTGQLQTRTTLDYETKSSYTVTITASDGKTNGIDTITVTINVTDVNEVNNNPQFTEGDSTTRSIAENTAAGTDIGSPLSATDEDTHNVLTYSLGGTDAASFDIVSTTGQLQTKAALDYETKTTYTVTVSVSDEEEGSDTITVTINVQDVLDTNRVPMFSDGATKSLSIVENTAAGENIGSPITASDPDGDTFTYSFGGVDSADFDFNTSTAQIKTKSALDYETKSSYTVTITATDTNSGAATITVTINVTDSTSENTPPVFSEGSSTTRDVDEHLEEDFDSWLDNASRRLLIGSPITATDANGHSLTYRVVSGHNAWKFRINSSGQLSSGFFFDHEFTSSYSITVSVDDGNGGTDSIDVTVNVTDLNESPYYGDPDGPDYSDITITVYATQDAAANTNIGDPITASDYDANTTLSYTLSGTDVSSFTINSTTGQITNNNVLDANTKSSYSVIVTASDGSKSIDISVTIEVGNEPDPLVSARSPAIRQALVNAIDGVDSPADITTAHLDSITSLNLANKSISSLSAGDFNDLVSLRRLDLRDNTITSLPDGILDQLTALDYFTIEGNRISSLNGNLFQNNSGLTDINLRFNNFSTLPDGLFEGLTNISDLRLLQSGDDPEIITTVKVVEDDDGNDQTAKYQACVPAGSPTDITVEVWAVRRNLQNPYSNSYYVEFLTKHADLTIAAGSTTSDTVTITREDGLEDSRLQGDDPAIYLATKSPTYTRTIYLDIDYEPSQDRILVIPADTSNGAPSINTKVLVPDTTALLPNFPNPFNPETWIPYQLNKPSDVSITIYDIQGNVVRHIVLGQKRAGYYTDRTRAAHWDGRNAVGERVANGVYFYQLKAADYSYMRKMLIVK